MTPINLANFSKYIPMFCIYSDVFGDLKGLSLKTPNDERMTQLLPKEPLSLSIDEAEDGTEKDGRLTAHLNNSKECQQDQHTRDSGLLV